MNDKELEKVWRALDTRIETLNKRTKTHTLYIQELRRQVKELMK
jgi:chaperonin cofactor prefoldin